MIRVVSTLTVAGVTAWLILSMLITASIHSTPIAQAGAYLYVSACREALQGHDGTDNDVWREISALNVAGSNVIRWSWTPNFLRVDSGHVVQPFSMRRANGQLVTRYYFCYWASPGRIADARVYL